MTFPAVSLKVEIQSAFFTVGFSVHELKDTTVLVWTLTT
jgi:hypothetical protein